MSAIPGYYETPNEMLAAWDAGQTVFTIECGGLGPGHEQALQIAAIEFTRACKDMEGIKPNDKESTKQFRDKCDEVLAKKDEDLGGLSGAMVGAAQWLAFQWCFNGGPTALLARAKKDGLDDRIIQISKHWPKA